MSTRRTPLYWLCYRPNNQISVVIEPGASPIHARMRAALNGLDKGEFTESHELDRKMQVPKEMIGRRLTQAEAKRLLGGSVRIDYRFAPASPDQARAYAKELVGLQPDVLVGNSTPATAALLHETRTIPIVFVGVSDPVGSHFVASIARPGGITTGFTNFAPSMVGKWLEMLKQIAPTILEPFEEAARSFAVEPVAAPAKDADELATAVAAMTRDPGGSLIIMPDAFTTVHRQLIILLSARYALPAIYPYRYQAFEGGLLSYGVDDIDLMRRAAPYVDRILKGEKVANLPVQAPVKFYLVINLRAAKVLGLTVPPTLIALADEVIE